MGPAPGVPASTNAPSPAAVGAAGDGDWTEF
jgi:hypothetical protein